MSSLDLLHRETGHVPWIVEDMMLSHCSLEFCRGDFDITICRNRTNS